MQLEIVSPEAQLFSGEVLSVTVPGASGSFQILNNTEYSDIDWYLRSMKNILLHVKENNFFELNNILQILKKNNLTVYKKMKALIKNLRENNIILKEFKI